MTNFQFRPGIFVAACRAASLRLLLRKLSGLTVQRFPAVVACALALSALPALGLGGDHPNGEAVSVASWPKGLGALVNGTNRVGGFWVNSSDTFFFTGTKSGFGAFLQDYSKVQQIEKPLLILHDGKGEAYDLGGGNRRPCDWMLTVSPKDGAHWNSNSVVEVHFWTGGKIAYDPAAVPKNIEVKAVMEPNNGAR
jgi:hypothetical protein